MDTDGAALTVGVCVGDGVGVDVGFGAVFGLGAGVGAGFCVGSKFKFKFSFFPNFILALGSLSVMLKPAMRFSRMIIGDRTNTTPDTMAIFKTTLGSSFFLFAFFQ